jgi:hypothetical protein
MTSHKKTDEFSLIEHKQAVVRVERGTSQIVAKSSGKGIVIVENQRSWCCKFLPAMSRCGRRRWRIELA